MGLVQKGTLVVFYIRMPRETERHQRKERRTQEYLALNQQLITSEGEKVKGKHPLLSRREKDRLTTNARQVWRPDLRLELKFLNCLYRHDDGEEKPSKRSKSEGTQWAVAILTEKKKRSKVVYLKIQIQRSLFCGKLGKREWTLRRDTQYKIRRTALGTKFKFGNEKGHLEALSKKVNLMSEILVPKFEERTLEETSRQEEYARKAAWNLARKLFELKAEDKATFYSPVKIKTPVLVSKNTEERVFVVDSGAFNSHAEQEWFKLRRNGHFWPQWRSANKRGGTSVRSRSRSVRHSAISRWKASSSIAW